MAEKKQPLDKTTSIFLQDIKSIFKDDLISIVLYGSAARGDYFAKKSDINFLVVLTDSAINRISDTFNYIKKWTKSNISIPLFLTEHYIATSVDAFPIEFLNLKLHHKLLFGKDILSSLEIPDMPLRLKCEEQIKSKLLHLRQNFLLTQGKKVPMRQLLIQTIPTLASIFMGLIILKKADVPDSKEQILINTAHLYGLNEAVLQQVLDVRMASIKLSQNEIKFLLHSYIDELARLSDIIDQWKN